MTTHGMTGTPTYRSWRSMIQRCNNPSMDSYVLYGGKGIKYDKRWEKFEAFFEDMGVRPEGMTLDRIDSSKDYTPENCRWADNMTQNRNRAWMQKNNTSGARGIYYMKDNPTRIKRWKPILTYEGKKYFMGIYLTKDEAEKAWWEKYNELSQSTSVVY